MQVEIKMDNGSRKVFKQTPPEPIIRRVPLSWGHVKVRGSAGREYTLTHVERPYGNYLRREAVSCTCAGFHFRGYCRHIKEFNRG